MKQTFKLLSRGQAQKMQMVGASRFRHQAVAAALNVNTMASTSTHRAPNSLFSHQARFFAASKSFLPRAHQIYLISHTESPRHGRLYQ